MLLWLVVGMACFRYGELLACWVVGMMVCWYCWMLVRWNVGMVRCWYGKELLRSLFVWLGVVMWVFWYV